MRFIPRGTCRQEALFSSTSAGYLGQLRLSTAEHVMLARASRHASAVSIRDMFRRRGWSFEGDGGGRLPPILPLADGLGFRMGAACLRRKLGRRSPAAATDARRRRRRSRSPRQAQRFIFDIATLRRRAFRGSRRHDAACCDARALLIADGPPASPLLRFTATGRFPRAAFLASACMFFAMAPRYTPRYAGCRRCCDFRAFKIRPRP